ncbi:ABC-2 family transporter protein [Candidatus Woesebacteria bacterium]|nr:ABC-2 family transporter protein [Candidatus Woesebacteria bacterium]
MKKYWSIFKISFQQEFVYRLNFIMWRVRNVIQIFLVYFLWSTIFSDNTRTLFGYDRAKILTYIFGILIVRAVVLSARAVDVTNEIARGDLTNYLLKPISYFKYWLTRDLSSKVLNLFFAVFEFLFLYLILRPEIFLQTDPFNLIFFAISLMFAVFLFFVILFITSAVSFWAPEISWGAQFFIIFVIIEFLSGSLFPIDILPVFMQKILYLTPFPYLIFFPLQVYLGKISDLAVLGGLLTTLVWSVTLWFLMTSIWRRGIRIYKAEGR